MHLDPIHQFQLKKLLPISIFGLDISVTNSAATMVAVSLIFSLFLAVISLRLSYKPGRLQSTIEIILSSFNKMLEDGIGHPIDKKSRKYSKYIFSIFLFIWGLNFWGMIPFTFAPTAQFAVTLMAGITVMIVTFAISIGKHGVKVLNSFVPNGTPSFMFPIILPLEILSFLIRPISLCVRLGANIIAGHVVLEIIAGLTAASSFLFAFPFAIMVCLNLMEFAIITLQAYIFTLLTSSYISQAFHH